MRWNPAKTLFILPAFVLACGPAPVVPEHSTASVFLTGNAEEAYTDGMRAWRSRDLGTATGLFRRSLEVNPRYLAAHLALGEVLYEQGALNESLDTFNQALLIRPTSVEGQIGRARVLGALNRLPEALESARNAVDNASAGRHRDLEAQARSVYGMIQALLGNTVEAREAYEEALDLDSTTTEARIGVARIYASEGRVSEAASTLSLAGRVETSPSLLLDVARLLYELEAFEQSHTILEGLHTTLPNVDELTFLYAATAARIGQHDQSNELATALINRNPGFLAAYVVRGEGSLRRGYTPSARNDVEVVLSREPNNYEALILLGDIEAAENNVEAAIRAYETAINADPERLRAVEQLADLLYMKRLWAPYSAIVSRYVERDDRPAIWLASLAEAYIQQGLEAQAAPWLAASSDLDHSSHFRAHQAAAIALRHPGTLPPERILELARRSIEYVGGATLPYRLALIDALILNDQRSEARNVLRTAESLFPNSTELQERRAELR